MLMLKESISRNIYCHKLLGHIRFKTVVSIMVSLSSNANIVIDIRHESPLDFRVPSNTRLILNFYICLKNILTVVELDILVDKVLFSLFIKRYIRNLIKWNETRHSWHWSYGSWINMILNLPSVRTYRHSPCEFDSHS